MTTLKTLSAGLLLAAATTGAAQAADVVTILDQPGWCNWCPSPAYLPDGRVALAFSRWPTKFGFEAWCAKSEIALAVSSSGPLGPYAFVKTILSGSGRDGDFDRDVTHNPCLFVDGGKYYLYYMGTYSDLKDGAAPGASSSGTTLGSFRTNQRVGVAVADCVEGPYRRTGKPLFALEPDMTMMSNPAVCRMPNGKYLIVVKWGESDGGIVRGWPKCRTNLFAAIGDSPLGPFTIVNRDAFGVNCANFPGEDPYLWTEGETICCAIHDMGHFYSPEERALIRFESKDGVKWTNKGVLFPRGEIERLERPAILCGKDGSRLLFAASKPTRKDPNSLIVAYPGVVPEPLKAKPAPAPMRFMTFNIWGDYFKNPVEEREDAILRTVLRQKPDLLSLQEVTPNWWKSKFFRDLAADYGVIRGDEDAALVRAGGDLAERKPNWTNHEPLLYRKDRLKLLDSGLEFFHLSIGAAKSVTWGVFEDRRDGRRLISFATHFWYRYKGPESHALRELNARMILDAVAAAKAKWGDLPVIGGGDLNCYAEGMPALLVFERAGYSDAGKCADVFSTVPSEHTAPKRGADGRYRGEKGVVGKPHHAMLDRVFYTGGIHAFRHDVDCTQETLDATDHSPVVVDFALVVR